MNLFAIDDGDRQEVESLANVMAVQNSGLQDLIDPAQAGRGTVPASGLATFDLLALTGAAGTDGLVTIGNYKELSMNSGIGTL